MNMTSKLIFQFAGGKPVSWLSSELNQVDKDDIREMILQTTYARSLLMQLYDEKEPTPELKSYWQTMIDSRNVYSAFEDYRLPELRAKIQVCLTKYQTSHPFVNPAALLPELLLRFVGPSQFLLMILSDIRVHQLTPEDAARLFKIIWERSSELYCKNLDVQIVATRQKGEPIRRFSPSESSPSGLVTSRHFVTPPSPARALEVRVNSDVVARSETLETPPPPYHLGSEPGSEEGRITNLRLGGDAPNQPDDVSSIISDLNLDASNANVHARGGDAVVDAAGTATTDEVCLEDYLNLDAVSPDSTGSHSSVSIGHDVSSDIDIDTTHDSASHSSNMQDGSEKTTSNDSIFGDDSINGCDSAEVCLSPEMSDVDIVSLDSAGSRCQDGGDQDYESGRESDRCSSDFAMVDADTLSDTSVEDPTDSSGDTVSTEVGRELPKVKAELLRKDFIGVVEQMLRMPDFEGIFEIEDLPKPDWQRLEEAATPDPLGEDYYTAVQWSHFDDIEGLAKLHDASSRANRKFRSPYNCPSPTLRPTVEEAERILDSLCNKPGENEKSRDSLPSHGNLFPAPAIQYIVGPAMTDEYEGFLSCGTQLEREVVGECPGINTLYTMIGEPYSGTALHIEDNGYWSCNINLDGYKIWTCIEPEARDAFESAIKDASKACNSASTCGTERQSQTTCDQFVRHQSLVASPKWLRANEIPFKILCAGPGEAVITRPNQYHSVVNVGRAYSCAMNFVMPGQEPFPSDVKTCKECGMHPVMQDIQGRRSPPDMPRLRPRKQRKLLQSSDEADRQSLLKQVQQYAPDFILPFIKIDAVSVHVVKLAAVLTGPSTMSRLARIAIAAFESPIHITQKELGGQDMDGFIFRYRKDDESVRRQQFTALVQRRLRVDMAQICSKSITGGRRVLRPGFVQLLRKRLQCSYDSINSRRKEGQTVLNICRGHHGLLALLPFHGSDMDVNFAYYVDLRKEDTALLHDILEKNDVRYLCAIGTAVIEFVFQGPDTPFVLNGNDICLAGQGEPNFVEKVTENMFAASTRPKMQCNCDVSKIDSPLAALL